jgi:hypothetical protein
MTPQEMLKQMIDKAWEEFSIIAQEEEEDDYSDAMVSMERTHAEGYAEGLSSAYSLIFNEEYLPEIGEQ